MNCEGFAKVTLDEDLFSEGPDSVAAREHLRACSDCAGLYERSLALRSDLRELGQATSDATAPPRVEMRLRQEFRTRHKTDKNRGRVVMAGWLLATAALVLAAASLVMWHRRAEPDIAKVQRPAT